MHSQQPPSQPNASAPGARLETLLTSEVTLVPFPAGSYRIAVGAMEHPSKSVVETSFPAVLVTVLPGCRGITRLDTADGVMAWLQRAGDQTVLTVANPGGLVLFTTYRPSDYPTTGIRMDIERIKTGAPPQAAPQPPPSRPSPPARRPFRVPSPRAFPGRGSDFLPVLSARKDQPQPYPGGFGLQAAAPQPAAPPSFASKRPVSP